MRKTWVVGAVLVLALASCSKGESKHSLKGSVKTKVDLVGAAETASNAEIDSMFKNGSPCVPGGTKGLSGAQVVVKGADGSVIATTDLDDGTTSGKGIYCTLRFETEVPSSDFYRFEIDGEGDPVTYSKAELEDANWTVAITSS